jgi:hypothetical protein
MLKDTCKAIILAVYLYGPETSSALKQEQIEGVGEQGAGENIWV